MKKTIGIVMVLLMLMSVTVAFAGNAKDAQTGGEKVKVIIGYVDKPNQADEDVIRGHGGKTKYTHNIINAKAVEIPEQAIDRIKRNPRVVYVEEDAKVYALEDILPWGVDRIDAELVWNGTDGGCDITTGRNTGDGVKVAIIDTGIDYNHPDLSANYVEGIGYREGVVIDPMDDHGHGTHCAGIVAAADNGGGVIGVAPEVDLCAVKALNQYYDGYYGYNSDIVAGIEWSITNGMQIISMSLGSNSPSEAIEDACDKAYGSGIVVVAAAGNDYSSRGRVEFDTVGYPARYESVIAVGATDSYDERAYFSSTGPDVELAAPGVSIYSTIIEGGYATMSGTSMACPHVAGTAALVMIAYPDWTNVQVRQQLRDTADDIGAAGFDYWYGYGLVDADEAALLTDSPPAVNIVNPTDGNTVSGNVAIQVNASDDTGVSEVGYCIDEGAYQAMTYNSSTGYWEATWNSATVADDLYTITARAMDTVGQTSADSVIVTVDNIDEPPTVEITTPVDGVTVSGTITIEALASDDRGVSNVSFYINDMLLATDDTEPYNASCNTTKVADGACNITAIAIDTAGQTASDMNGVTVDNTPPAQVTNLIVTTVSSSQLNLSWSATETDLDHYNVYRNTTSGGPYNLVASPTTNSYSDAGLAASTTYYYTVTAVDMVGNEGIASEEASETTSKAVAAKYFANQDIPVTGTVSGSYEDTHDSDDIYESITEVSTRGRPSSRYSYLEHKWAIDVTSGTKVAFYVEAYHTGNTENDDFIFAYSTDGSTYNYMLTVTKTGDDDPSQTFELPETLCGTVYIRVVDTDRTGGYTALDTIYIDQMYIECVP